MKIKLSILIGIVCSSSVSAFEISKSDWIDAMESALPAAFCKSDMYFRKCYDVSAVQCEETAASATRICSKKLESGMPDVFEQPEDGTVWGEKVGECAGNTYDITLSEERIDSELCNDLSNWL